MKGDKQCVDCGRELVDEEFDLNGYLCDGCDHYRREMRNEPPMEFAAADGDKK